MGGKLPAGSGRAPPSVPSRTRPYIRTWQVNTAARGPDLGDAGVIEGGGKADAGTAGCGAVRARRGAGRRIALSRLHRLAAVAAAVGRVPGRGRADRVAA